MFCCVLHGLYWAIFLVDWSGVYLKTAPYHPTPLKLIKICYAEMFSVKKHLQCALYSAIEYRNS